MSIFWSTVKAGAKTKTGQKIISALTGGSKKSSTIKSFKPKKNLTERRKTFDEMVAAVDKHTKSKTTKTSKIKRDAALEGSKIHDKYEKLEKTIDKADLTREQKIKVLMTGFGKKKTKMPGMVRNFGDLEKKLKKLKNKD